MNNKVVFYIATKRQYYKEAVISCESIKEKMDIDVILFHDTGVVPDISCPFDLCIDLPNSDHEKFFYKHTVYMSIAHNYLLGAGYHHAVYIDCDTYCCAPFDEVFLNLKYVDFMGCHAPARQTTASVLQVPDSFPEINIGFNPMVLGKPTDFVLTNAIKLYSKNEDEYKNNDQGALRDSLWEALGSNYVVGILPPEYNLRFNFPCSAAKTVKILHGHSDNIAEIAVKANSTKEMRAWTDGIR